MSGYTVEVRTAILTGEHQLHASPKGVSIALHLEKPCHVAHALN